MDFIKVNDNEIKVVEMKEEAHIYPYEWLIERRNELQRQKDIAVSEFDIKLAEVNKLIEECNKLGIIAKAVEAKEIIM
jgi:hypothetical protein